uniref:Uncharacterized protein n=1 Tax=Romanomermis culicivorax TaxID=13658 RepID=A0A915LBG0_ROMCU
MPTEIAKEVTPPHLLIADLEKEGRLNNQTLPSASLDNSEVALLQEVEHLAVLVGCYFVNNNNQHLDLVRYYYYMAAVGRNYQIQRILHLQICPDYQNFDYTYCCHDSMTFPDSWAESIQGEE